MTTESMPMLKHILRTVQNHKAEYLSLFIVLCIAGITHGFNMFHFPYYENDEGTYMSQAWAILRHGTLAPYTYWYDHAPGGWILIALWVKLSGGFYTFGSSVNSGRVLMFILHIASSIAIYYIAKKVTGNRFVGLMSILIFSFTPLGIYFQRRVLLDNIMIFWVLISLVTVLYCQKKLRHIILSAVLFGFSILSKENAIFFIPAFLYVIYTECHPTHKVFALTKWIVIVGGVVSLYFLYAFIKGELFQTGTLLGGMKDHVSLLTTLKNQYSRPGGSILEFQKASFWQNMRLWITRDPVIIYAGIITTICNILLAIKIKSARLISFLSALFWFFLIRGGIVIEFYIIPIIPILALNISILLSFQYEFLKKILHESRPRISIFVPLVFFLGIIGGMIFYDIHPADNINLFTADQTKAQEQALQWMLSRSNPTSFYVIDAYGWVDLHDKNSNNFKNAEWYWKVDLDPAIKGNVLRNSAQNIDFIAATPQMEKDVIQSNLIFTSEALLNAVPDEKFWNDGWGVYIWSTTYPHNVLTKSWQSYVRNFIKDGRVIDPYQQNSSTSEGQAYALLRAVWINDKNTFDSVLKWTNKNMRQGTGLFGWKFGEKENAMLDEGNATDADQDIALALIFASKSWNNASYLAEAKEILNEIWNKEISLVNGNPYVSAGNWASQQTSITLNPSYLSPASYRVFSQVDPSHNWLGAVDTSYDILNKCTEDKLDKTKGVLPPEWCAVNILTGEAQLPDENQPRSTEYSYNAFRIPWRIALDYSWSNEPRAKEFLSKLKILEDQYTIEGLIHTAYTHDGAVWENYESVAAYSGNLGYFTVMNPSLAQQIYKTKILAKFYENQDNSYWDDPKNYYDQNMAWFATALFSNSLPNLWNK